MRCGSLSSASVDCAPSQAACLRCCRDPSHRVLVDQSEASPMKSPPYAQYGRNVPHLAETKKILQSAARRAEDATPRLGLPLPQTYSQLNVYLSVSINFVRFFLQIFSQRSPKIVLRKMRYLRAPSSQRPETELIRRGIEWATRLCREFPAKQRHKCVWRIFNSCFGTTLYVQNFFEYFPKIYPQYFGNSLKNFLQFPRFLKHFFVGKRKCPFHIALKFSNLRWRD